MFKKNSREKNTQIKGTNKHTNEKLNNPCYEKSLETFSGSPRISEWALALPSSPWGGTLVCTRPEVVITGYFRKQELLGPGTENRWVERKNEMIFTLKLNCHFGTNNQKEKKI